ncbi:dynamin-binding protein isoform X1 [Nematostella vectensis]|uniref:dynamin-binding protein isoform X1 n=1 Tax=Nematostella vectensis TaxID=45351 RepID=UPI00207749F7|nr:dynamin-binding protein isoform X1 [Nematostella vectensis]
MLQSMDDNQEFTVRSLYPFTATSSAELTAKEGDILKVLSHFDEHWYNCELNSKKGLFPISYTEKIDNSYTIDRYVVAIQSYSAQRPGEISLKKGDFVKVLEEIGNNWLRGDINGTIGIFPCVFVEDCSKPEDSKDGEELYSNFGFYENLDITFAEALYGFEARNKDELSFPMGAEIVVTKDVDNDWYEGTFEGDTGLFPKSYVRIMDPPVEQSMSDDNKRPYARSIYPFVAENDSELTFKEGEIIQLRERAGSQWLIGELGGKTGRFPASFVNIEVDLPPENTRVYSLHSYHFSPERINWTIGMKARALYHFSALHSGDLELSEGDVITVLKIVDDNWLEGRLQSGVSGTCPIAYLEPLMKTNTANGSLPKASIFMELKAGLQSIQSTQTTNKPAASNGVSQGTSRQKGDRSLLDSSFSEDTCPTLRPSGFGDNTCTQPSAKPKPAPRPPSVSLARRRYSSGGDSSRSSQSSVFDATSPTAEGLPSPITPTINRTSIYNTPFNSKSAYHPVSFGTVKTSGSQINIFSSEQSNGKYSGNNESSKGIPKKGIQSVSDDTTTIIPRRKAPPPPKVRPAGSRTQSLPRGLQSSDIARPGGQCKSEVDGNLVNNRSLSRGSIKQASGQRPEGPQKKAAPPPPARPNQVNLGGLARSATVSSTSKEEWRKSSPTKSDCASGGGRRQRPYSLYYVGEDRKDKDLRLCKSTSVEDIQGLRGDVSVSNSQTAFDKYNKAAMQSTDGMHNLAYEDAGDIPGIEDLDETISDAEKNLQVEKKALSGMKTISQMLVYDEAKHREMDEKMARSQQKVDEWQEILSSLQTERSYMVAAYSKRKQFERQMESLESDLEKQLRSQKSLEELLKVVEASRREEVQENLRMCGTFICELNTKIKKLEVHVDRAEKHVGRDERGGKPDLHVNNRQAESMQSLSQPPTRSSQQHMAEQRQKVLTELLNTERDYIRDLQTCLKYFYEELKNTKVVDAEVLFGNMHSVVETSTRLLGSFEAALQDDKQQELGKCFAEHAEEIKSVYSTYCKNHDDAIGLLEKYEDCLEAQEAFRKCLDAVRDTTKCWDLSSFLIKPVQRVLKYPLLLSELLKCTPQIHKDKDNLVRALSAMTEVAATINEVKRRKDLVVKYKKTEESGISNKFQKLSWHSVMKKSSRFTQKLTQSTGLVNQTVDKSFNEEEKKFNNLEKTVKNLIKNVSSYVEQFQDTVTRQEVNGQNIQEYYLDASTCTEVTLYQSTQQRISGILLDAFMGEVQYCVLTPLNSLLAMFQGPQRLIQKRHHKCLDYDSWSNKMEKIKDKDKLKQAKEELESAKRNYEALNAQLLEELPLFRQKTMSLVKDCVLNFAHAKRKFHAAIHGEYNNLSLLSLVKDGCQDIVQHQVERTARAIDHLASLSFMPPSFSGKESVRKKHKSSPHKKPAVPPAPDLSLTRKRMAPPPPTPSSGPMLKPERPTPVPRKSIPSEQKQKAPKGTDVGAVESLPYIALCTFEGQNAGEISVNEGDLVTVQRRCDTSGNTEWWLVSYHGRKGYIPGDFLDPFDPTKDDEDEDEGIDEDGSDSSDLKSPTFPTVDMVYFAQFDFEGTSEAEVSIDAGQLVTVLQKHDLEGNPEWWLVEAEGKRGYVAADFLASFEDS